LRAIVTPLSFADPLLDGVQVSTDYLCDCLRRHAFGLEVLRAFLAAAVVFRFAGIGAEQAALREAVAVARDLEPRSTLLTLTLLLLPCDSLCQLQPESCEQGVRPMLLWP
jgi:hypothetical protein